jgi:CheY-like chemotaxis protein
MISRPCVLIADRSAETREILRMALAARGTQVWETTRAAVALELARTHRPDVIVLDLDIAQAANETVRAALVYVDGQGGQPRRAVGIDQPAQRRQLGAALAAAAAPEGQQHDIAAMLGEPEIGAGGGLEREVGRTLPQQPVRRLPGNEAGGGHAARHHNDQ